MAILQVRIKEAIEETLMMTTVAGKATTTGNSTAAPAIIGAATTVVAYMKEEIFQTVGATQFRITIITVGMKEPMAGKQVLMKISRATGMDTNRITEKTVEGMTIMAIAVIMGGPTPLIILTCEITVTGTVAEHFTGTEHRTTTPDTTILTNKHTENLLIVAMTESGKIALITVGIDTMIDTTVTDMKANKNL
jgi:hypothetical protein